VAVPLAGGAVVRYRVFPTRGRENKEKHMRDVVRFLGRLHRDERGAEGLEKLLIVAAIVLPLLGLLIWGRNAITEWVKKTWDEIVTQRSTTTDTGPLQVP
jgi:Flp pilus assembly pilin Flp